jgi:predicted acylesterase/phospholipase RssA
MCKIVDACLATSAATTFFNSITINGIIYVDGGFGQNNPSSVALKELEQSDWLLPMKDAVTEVACFVSIGTGRPTYGRDEQSLISYVKPKGVKSMEEAVGLCISIASGCHEQHLEIKERYAAFPGQMPNVQYSI